METVDSISKNPLENYKTFNQFNLKNLIKQWIKYIHDGVDELLIFLKSILNKFNCLSVEYIPYQEDIFIPYFRIKIPESIKVSEHGELWDKIYDELYKYALINDIVPSFYRLFFNFYY